MFTGSNKFRDNCNVFCVICRGHGAWEGFVSERVQKRKNDHTFVIFSLFSPPPPPLPLAAQPLHFQKRSAAPDWLFNSLVLIQRKSALPSSYGSYFNRNRGNCNSLLQLPLAEVTIFGEIFFYLSFGIRRWNFSKIWPKNIISKYTKMTAVAHPHICPEEKQW